MESPIRILAFQAFSAARAFPASPACQESGRRPAGRAEARPHPGLCRPRAIVRSQFPPSHVNDPALKPRADAAVLPEQVSTCGDYP